MKLRELEIHGFGKLCERGLSFDPNFTVVYGANEAGKLTVAIWLARDPRIVSDDIRDTSREFA